MKHILTGLTFISLLFSSGTVFAETNLTDGDATNECVSFKTSILRFGMRDSSTDGEVTILQDFLISKGVLAGQTTGYYGRLTVSAVKAYQKSIGVSPTGNVGPLTKSLIAKETCSDSAQAPATNPTANTVPDNRCGAFNTRCGETQNQPTQTNPVSQYYPGVPTCKIASDKSSYKLGDKIVFTYESEGATYATWIKDSSGKDNLYVPGDKLDTRGTYTVEANIEGNPSVTLGVYGMGGYGKCTKVVKVESGSSFESGSYINIISPNGGETFTLGKTIALLWKSSQPGSGSVSIYLRDEDSGKELTLEDSTSNSGYYEVKTDVASVPGIVPGRAYRIKVCLDKSTTYGHNCDVKDTTDMYFKIVSPVTLSPTCKVTQQTWPVYNNPFTISWSSANAAYGVGPYGDKIDLNGSATYQLSTGEEKTYKFTFFDIYGKEVTCSTFFSSLKG